MLQNNGFPPFDREGGDAPVMTDFSLSDPEPPGEAEQLTPRQKEQSVAQAVDSVSERDRREDEEKQKGQPDWDGSEAQFVPDDGAAEYEDQYAGIGLNYALRREEVLACLKRNEFSKHTGRRRIVETVALGVVAALFLSSCFVNGWGSSQQSLLLGVLALALIAVIWIAPRVSVARRARELADGKKLHVQVYPDCVQVCREGGQPWEIALDGTSGYAEYEGLMVLSAPGKGLLAIPQRAVEPGVLADVQAMLVAGSRPQEEED